MDGTLVDAWASMKSFRLKDGSGEPPTPGRNSKVDFRGEPRSNQTHAPTTDASARLYKKAAGQAAKLCHIAHGLVENRDGLVGTSLTKTTGTVKREAAITMIEDLPDDGRITLGTDKGYDTQDFVTEMRRLGVTTHKPCIG